MSDSGGALPDLDPGRGLEVVVGEVKGILDLGAVPGSVRLIDCREEDEFAICSLPGAELIPLSRFGETDFTDLVENGQPAVIYCHHGMRSAHAAAYPRSKGHGLAFSMAGGIERWSVEIDPEVVRY